MLEGVENSFDNKIDPVLQKLEACLPEIASLNTRMTEAEGCISNSEDAAAADAAAADAAAADAAAAFVTQAGDGLGQDRRPGEQEPAVQHTYRQAP